MSYVVEPGICYCGCHNPLSGMRHCVPCCEKCPVCKKNVKRGSTHIEACQKRFDDLVKAQDPGVDV